MSKITIVGAGDVGATLAYTLQIEGRATEIVLVDERTVTAHGHALDMNHGQFFTPPVRIRAGSLQDAAGSDLWVIAAGTRQRTRETRLDLTRRNAEICSSIVQRARPWLGDARVLVVSNPVDVMTYTVWSESGLPRHRVFGSGTVLDSARFRYELSRWCDVDPRNVHAYVAGEHGDSEVFLWSRVHVAGNPLGDFCRHCRKNCGPQERQSVEQRVRDSAYHIIEAKGYTNYGVSLAVSRMIGAVLRDEKSVFTASAVLDGEYGLHEVSLSVPCVLGAAGVHRIVETELPAEESQQLDRSAHVVRSAIHSVDEARHRAHPRAA